MQKPRIQRAVAPPLPCIRSGSSCRSEVVTGLALPHPRAAWQPLGEAPVKDLDPSLQSTPKASGFCQCQLSPPGQAMPQGIRSTLGVTSVSPTGDHIKACGSQSGSRTLLQVGTVNSVDSGEILMEGSNCRHEQELNQSENETC